jgi:hypothetical protein
VDGPRVGSTPNVAPHLLVTTGPSAPLSPKSAELRSKPNRQKKENFTLGQKRKSSSTKLKIDCLEEEQAACCDPIFPVLQVSGWSSCHFVFFSRSRADDSAKN